MDCGRCWKCKEGTGCIRSVSVAPSAMPSRNGGAEAARINATDKGWEQDMGAYKRIRWDGVQPRKIDGCAELEARATDQFEVELGLIVPKERRPAVMEGLALAKELELRPEDLQKAKADA